MLPCLNEAETLETCITKALAVAETSSGWSARSSSPTTARPTARRTSPRRRGARVVDVAGAGYGAALLAGIGAAAGQYVHHGRRGRQLRPRRPRPVHRAAARRARPGDGQPLQGRHRARRHAVAAPLPGQPGAVAARPAVLPHPGRRLPLRHPRLPPRPDPGARPAHARHGVRQRDGRAGVAGRLRIAEVPTTLRPDGRSRAAAPAHLARRLAAPAVPARVQPALALLLPVDGLPVHRTGRCAVARARAAQGGRRRVRHPQHARVRHDVRVSASRASAWPSSPGRTPRTSACSPPRSASTGSWPGSHSNAGWYSEGCSWCSEPAASSRP